MSVLSQESLNDIGNEELLEAAADDDDLDEDEEEDEWEEEDWDDE